MESKDKSLHVIAADELTQTASLNHLGPDILCNSKQKSTCMHPDVMSTVGYK